MSRAISEKNPFEGVTVSKPRQAVTLDAVQLQVKAEHYKIAISEAAQAEADYKDIQQKERAAYEAREEAYAQVHLARDGLLKICGA